MRTIYKLLASAALFSAAQSALATSAQWVNVTSANTPGGFQSWDLKLTLTGSDDFLSARMHVTGTFYQDALGTDNSAPNPAFFGAFPALQFDTYVASPTASSATVLGAFDGTNEGPPPATFSNSELGIVWGDTIASSAGTYTIAQITFSGTPSPIAGRISFGPDSNNIQNLTLPQVPEPMSIGLVGLGALTMLRKRRA